MKNRSHRTAAVNEQPDDWGDETWTVDCACGVNFDDGEEMVNCDDCGVWVHTRCSRFVKGQTSFACDVCKFNNDNNSKETEVAQLLVELPTKTITMSKSSLRLCTQIPLEERVHVQGLPGGDPKLFQGLSSVFTSDLWKCSGYVPKKFNFHYREFPCWEEEEEEAMNVDNQDHPVDIDTGADALFSLSNQIVTATPVGLRTSVEGGSSQKKETKNEGKSRVDNDASARYVHNGVQRETEQRRSFGCYLGKRKKDNVKSNDFSGKKKATSASKEVDGKKRVFTSVIGTQGHQAESLKLRETKVTEAEFRDSKNACTTPILDPVPDACLDMSRNRSKDTLTINAHYAGDSLKKAKLKDSLPADIHHTDDSSKKAKPKDKLAATAEDSFKKVKPKAGLEAKFHYVDDASKKGKSKDNMFPKPHNAEDFSKKVKPKDNLANNVFRGEDTSKEEWKNSSLVEIVVKSENEHQPPIRTRSLSENEHQAPTRTRSLSENEHQAPTRTRSSSETVTVEVSVLEPNNVSTAKKHEDLHTHLNCLDHHNDENHDPGELRGKSFRPALSSPKLKPPVAELFVVTGVQDCRAHQDSIKSTSPSYSRPDIEVKTEANNDQTNGNSGMLSSPIADLKLDKSEHLDQHPKISIIEHPDENIHVQEMEKSTFESDGSVARESKLISCCDKNSIVEGMNPISGELCQKKEVIGSAGTLSVQESSSENKYLENGEEPLKAVVSASHLSPLTQCKVVLGFGKSSSSSSAVVPKSDRSSSCKPPGMPASPSTLGPIHFTKRVKTNTNADIKKDHTVSVAVKDDYCHDELRKTTREQLKGPAPSASKSSHMSRISHASISKRSSSDSKESVLYSHSKAPFTHTVAVCSGSIESISTLQSQSVSHVQNKTAASDFSEKGDRCNQSGSNQSSKVTHLSSMHPPAPVNSSSTLSDEELALLLHQELNSSPRVPRVPRVRNAGSIPQLASPTATSMLIKRTSVSAVKDHISLSRRKNKEEALKDGFCNPRELIDETKKMDRVLSSNDYQGQDQVITSDNSTKKEALKGSPEAVHSAKMYAPPASTTTFGHSPRTELTDQNLSSLRSSPRNTSDDDIDDGDDDDAGGIAGPATRTLPGLLNEIMSKGKRMTYEELCNVVLPHWNNLRKHNGERYAYASHSQAVLDCLRNRNEWAQLVDRGPKTNAGRKKRKPDEPPPYVPEENEYGKSKITEELVGKKFETHPEDFPKGKRKARKRRRLALQGRGIRDVRNRQKVNAVTDDDLGSNSHSSDTGGIFSDDSQGARTRPTGSEASSSFD